MVRKWLSPAPRGAGLRAPARPLPPLLNLLSLILLPALIAPAQAAVFVSDPQGILRIAPGYRFTPRGLSHSLRVATNLPADPGLLAEVSRARFNVYTPCVAVVPARALGSALSAGAGFVKYEAAKGMGGFRAGNLRRLIAENWDRGVYSPVDAPGPLGGQKTAFAAPGATDAPATPAGSTAPDLLPPGRPTQSLVPSVAAPLCTPGNTVVFAVEGTPMDVHRTRQIAAWTVLLTALAFCGAAGIMVCQDDERPEDSDDEFSSLLYNAPDMKLSEEAFLDDEPWEAGGEDY